MKVKCKIDTLQKAKDNAILNDDILHWYKKDLDEEILKLNKIFEVYALLLTSTGIWVFIFEDYDDEFPKHYPLSFFDIIDSEIPSTWVLGKGLSFESKSRKVFALLSHPVWAEDESFYENLTDSNIEASQKFKSNFPAPTQILSCNTKEIDKE